MSTYTPIATQTLGSAAASVTFSSIPQGYTDLVLVCNSGQSTADNSYSLRVGTSNTIDTGSNYSDTALNGNGSSANSYRNSSNNRMIIAGSNSSSISDALVIHFQNYSNSTTYKTVLSRANIPAYRTVATVSLWRNTSPINTIQIYGGDNILAGSTFSIYGIQVGNAAQKAQGGNIVTSDGTYVYHAFTSSGYFIPNAALTADILVIAGGGGGAGGYEGSGGGAGGIQYKASATLVPASYTCTVGAGGAGRAYNTYINGGNGVDSSISGSGITTITANGGGGGGSYITAGTSRDGSAGGSGGGASRAATPGASNQSSSGGATSYGNAGGAGPGVTGYSSGGGGGAGAAGSAGGYLTGAGGAGGAGLNTWSSWASATSTGVSGYYAGGGGGAGNDGAGAGGTGGGGAGGVDTNAVSGTANTGGAGGGVRNNYDGGSGGSGIVIIRYLA